ncbi:glycosyltransferase family 2 protein [Butyrivibrio sp. AE2032]|uniref:glycosyltransferase family 2 protein n=1 Tax=Butyrivibrio sp. AE2032 TaxID=1458463 RepID=UPI0005544B58|nr:glycosyltransferase family 2 protein [Butyrivibrio sp. AE2032]
MPKISVVMPVHNTGPQLYKTLMSLMAQSEKNFEVLMVDDCSSDTLTIETEETFERFDPRFKLLKQAQNIGSGPARNVGLQTASGKYLIFLDSDDLFCDNMLKEMSETLDKTDADVCISNFMMLDIGSNEKSTICAKGKDTVTDRVFTMNELGEDGLSYWMPTPWNKMFKRTYIIDNNILFQDLTNCSDMYFGFFSVLKANSIAYCQTPEPLLIYRVNNPNQISFHMDSRNMIKAFKLLFENIDKNDKPAISQLLTELRNSLEPMMSRCPNKKYNQECLEGAKEIFAQYS